MNMKTKQRIFLTSGEILPINSPFVIQDDTIIKWTETSVTSNQTTITETTIPLTSVVKIQKIRWYDNVSKETDND